ncbi:MAG: SDR family oxidoreductase [Caldilineales bacterium]|nr:SDR family oxidoreductase [Caldilineales bacterium]
MHLTAKTAIVTGSGRGIGSAMALALGRQGANVAVNFFRNRAPAEATAAAIEAAGGKAIVVRAHVGRPGQVEQLVAETVAAFGGVDIFIANAASGVPRPLLEQEDREWDWTVDINARSLFHGVKAAAPYMIARGWGRVIGVTSMGSRRAMPNYGLVGVSKAAIETLIRYFAVELAPHGITCNAISPGIVLTDALQHFPNWEGMIAAAQERTPAGRFVTPEEVAELALFLCSPAAAGIIGQTIIIDGGYELMP